MWLLLTAVSLVLVWGDDHELAGERVMGARWPKKTGDTYLSRRRTLSGKQ